MARKVSEAVEAFLVEDVILTMSTIRGALGWLGSAEDCPPAARAEGFARIARQIAALEDRARDLWQDLNRAPRPQAEPQLPAPDNVFDVGAAPVPEAGRTVFRSRRGKR